MKDELKTNAIEWFTRLRADDAGSDDQRRHQAWLAEDPAHKAAYESVQREWQTLDELNPWAAAELRRLEEKHGPQQPQYRAGGTARRRNWLVAFGLSTCAAAALALVVIPLINPPGVYQTLEGEQRKLVLEDGSRAHLNSATKLQVRYNRDEREIVLLKGEALFDVVKDPSRPFSVKARESKVVAIGTTFSVYYNSGDIDVTVVQGQVAILPVQTPASRVIQQGDTQLSSAGTRQEDDTGTPPAPIRKTGVLLKANQQIRVNEQGEVGEPKAVDAAKLTSWERGMLVLDGMPLRQVAREISRYVPGDVQVASDVPDYPVTGVIEIRDQDTMLRLLSQVVPITAVRQSPQMTLLYAAANTAEDGN
jgi:transmembrane sensor